MGNKSLSGPDASLDIAPGSVVVGVDGSVGAARALVWATRQARVEHRPLALVHVVNDRINLWVGEPGVDIEAVLGAMNNEGRELLAAAVCSVPQDAEDGFVVHSVLGHGDPRRVLLALSRGASTIVVGSRGWGPVASLLLGSVSVGVSQHATCPVVVVRPVDPEGVDGLQVAADRVVVGVRTGRPVGHAAEFAFRQASLCSAPLCVVYGTWEELFGYAGSAVPNLDDQAIVEELESAVALVAGLREKFPDIEVSYQAAGGPPDSCLVAASLGSALVVVGSTHPNPATALLEGNVARSVTEGAHCAVAVVPES